MSEEQEKLEKEGGTEVIQELRNKIEQTKEDMDLDLMEIPRPIRTELERLAEMKLVDWTATDRLWLFQTRTGEEITGKYEWHQTIMNSTWARIFQVS